MYQLLIVDDSAGQSTALSRIISNYPENIKIQTAHDYSSAIFLVQNMKFDIYFLDLNSDTHSDSLKNALLLGKAIRSISSCQYAPVIFITAVPVLVQKALNDTGFFQYILKPFTPDEIISCLDYILHSPLVSPPEFTFINFWGGRIQIPEASILYFCTGTNRRICIFTENGIYETRCYTLEQLEHMLHHGFFRCHRKYLVNLKFITDYSRTNRIIYLGKESIPLGRSHKPKFEEIYRYL